MNPVSQLLESIKCPAGQEKNAAIAMAPKGEATHEERLRAALDSGILERDIEISVDGYCADTFTAIVRGKAEWAPGGYRDGSYKITLERTREDDFGNAEMEKLLMETIKATINGGVTINEVNGGSGLGKFNFIVPCTPRTKKYKDEEEDF